MIYLNEVCGKLSSVLNSQYNPADYLFAVESVGFHADTVYSNKDGKNLIRVYVSSMGGNFNPVYGLGQANYTIPITFYFPVRFKNDFFALDAYLHSVFVGAYLDYGTNSGKAVSNLSVATYGEIQNLDFKEFKNWADNVFKMPIEVMEQYMSMTVTLYLSIIGEGFIQANEVSSTLSLSGNVAEWELQSNEYKEIGDALGYIGLRCPQLDEYKTYVTPAVTCHFYAFATSGGVVYVDVDRVFTPVGTNEWVYYKKENGSFQQFGVLLNPYSSTYKGTFYEQIVFAQGSLQSMVQASEQKQLFAQTESDGIPYSESSSQSFAAYIKDTFFWRIVVLWQSLGALSSLEMELNWKIPSLHIDHTRKVYLASFNMPLTKGNPLIASLAFSKRSE